MPLKILVVEDHQDLAENICDYLESKKHIIDYAGDGLGGLHLAVTEKYDVIVLDVMLPGIDGLEVCNRLRQSAVTQPGILMLTALDTLDDKLSGFKAGVDDYLVKPFALEELNARLEAIATRNRGGHNSLLQVDALAMDTGVMSVTREGRQIKLNRACFQILKLLMEAYPNVLSRQEIEFSIWGEDPPDSDSLRSHIYKLRCKIDKKFSYPMIKTVHGVGFKLAGYDET